MRYFTFGGVTSDSMGLICLTVSRSFLPPLTAHTLAVPARAGDYYQRSDVGPLQIDVGVAVMSDSLVNLDILKQKIGGWLFPDDQLKALVVPDEPDKTYYAVLDGKTDLKLIFSAASGVLTFHCADPTGYGLQTNADFVNDTVSPSVDGTYRTAPVINATMTAAASNFTVTNTDTGEFVRVATVLSSGDTVTVDCAKELLQINGQDANADLDLLPSDFFKLKPGTNNIAISPAGVCTAKISWTPRWL